MLHLRDYDLILFGITLIAIGLNNDKNKEI